MYVNHTYGSCVLGLLMKLVTVCLNGDALIYMARIWPARAWFLKVAVKWIFHGNNCFLNIAQTKPFTPLNSRYSLSILSNR